MKKISTVGFALISVALVTIHLICMTCQTWAEPPRRRAKRVAIFQVATPLQQ